MSKTKTESEPITYTGNNKLSVIPRSVVPSTELDRIYRTGEVSPDAQKSFRTSLDKGIYSTQGISMDKFIETNRKIKIEMKEYLDNYKIQRNLMEAVIYYLRHPKLAGVRFTDKVGGLFGKKLQLEAKRIANDPLAITRLFEEMAISIEKSRNKTFELEKQSRVLYDASLAQRENIEKDIVVLLQKISTNKDMTIKMEDDYIKVKENMDKLLVHMEEKLDMKVRSGKPIFELEGITSPTGETLTTNNREKEISAERIDQLVKEEKFENIDIEKDTEKVENIDAEIGTTFETKDPRIKDKKKIEAIKVYHSINDKLVKAENALRDVRNEKLVLHQNYERAKENLTLYERVLINQVNEARNYFALLFAIYDAEVKYTLPSARLIANLASLQEVAIQLAQQIYDSRNIFNNLLDSVTQGALEIQEGIIKLAINPSWDPSRLDQNENRTMELTRRTREFAKYMDKRLTEIESTYSYRDPNVLIKVNEKPVIDSGVDDEYLRKLLTEK